MWKQFSTTIVESPRFSTVREFPMPTPTPTRTVDITAAPRVVITLATGLVTRVLGDMPTARENAWQAVLEDRARAAQRADLATVLKGAVASGARNNRPDA